MKTPKPGNTLIKIAKRAVSPKHTATLAKELWKRQEDSVSGHEAELRFCADVLTSDFLNYGFHEDPGLPPERISLHDIQQAQLRYSELVAAEVRDNTRPVLDAGCGMGGMLRLLHERGFNAVGLTPNRFQAQHIKSKQPGVSLLEGKFLRSVLKPYRGKFGTVVTAESFQYFRLSEAIKTIDYATGPKGRWVLADYFRVNDSAQGSGHSWDDFLVELARWRWRIVSERDITQNVLPTLHFLHMLGERVGRPAADFVAEKIRRKRPALNHLLVDVLQDWRNYAFGQLEAINPAAFARGKKYMLLVLERS